MGGLGVEVGQGTFEVLVGFGVGDGNELMGAA